MTAAPAGEANASAWAAPQLDGGDVPTFRVEASFNSGWFAPVASGLSVLNFTHSELVAGDCVNRVTAINNAGSGPALATHSGCASTVPGQVTGVVLTPGNGAIAASWTAPDDGTSAITDYKIEIRPDGGSFLVVNDGVWTMTSATITGLTNGNAYDLRIAAINAIGAGPVSKIVSATLAGAATTPANVTGLGVTPGEV